MGEERTWALVCVLSAAVLAATALADEPQDNQSIRPVDLKKDGFDVTLQALPSGELCLSLAKDDPLERCRVESVYLRYETSSDCHQPRRHVIRQAWLRRTRCADGVLCSLVPSMQALPATL